MDGARTRRGRGCVAARTWGASEAIFRALGVWLGVSASGACVVAPGRSVSGASRGSEVVVVAPDPASIGSGLPIPDLAVAWSPPVLVAGDSTALREQLAEAVAIEVGLGPRLDGPLWRGQVAGILQGLGAQASVSIGLPASMAEVFAQPLQVVLQGGEPGVATGELELAETWRQRRSATTAEDAKVVLIDDAPIDGARWRGLPAVVQGSCEPALQALALGQERSLAALEPWLDHADAVLWQIHRTHLRARLPGIRDGLKDWAAPPDPNLAQDPRGFERAECGHRLWQFVQRYDRCAVATGPCQLAPRLFLSESARVAAPEPDVFVPERCAALLGRDPVAELRRLAHAAAMEAVAQFDRRWVTLADRLATVTEVYGALEDLCTPRRRRFAPGDVQEARRRLAGIGEMLGSDDITPDGTWVGAKGRFHVPGVGQVRQLARYEAGAGSPARSIRGAARSLRQFVLSRALCRGTTGALPLALAVVDPRASAVSFVGFFYEEQLTCAGLPPA